MTNDRKTSGEGDLPPVLVVILNWNGWEDTLVSVDSVLRLDYSNLRVLVIDNAFTDGSVAHLRTVHDERVELLELPENLGFTGGCNEGFRRALATGAHYVWLLNNDAVVEDQATLGSLVALAESDPKIGLVSPRIAEMGGGGRLMFCGGVCSVNPIVKDETPDPKEAQRWALQYPNAGLVWGTAMLVKSSLIRVIGMLDEEFFAYFEDNDYSYRSSRAGYRNLVDENSLILHPERRSSIDMSAIKPYWWYYRARNECRFWRKHMGVIRALGPWRWNFNKAMRNIRRYKENREVSDAILAGLWHGWTNRGGAYRSEYRMPRLLAAAIRKYALAKSDPSLPAGDGQ